MARWKRRPGFVYPLKQAQRTAVLLAGFRSRRQARVFPEGFSNRVVSYAPRAIAGTLAQLTAMGSLPSLTHAVIVLQDWGDPLLAEENRARLWEIFGLPVFEQHLDSRRQLVAAECAAHSGLHLFREIQLGSAIVDRLPCPCGRITPRLIAWQPPLAAKAAGG